MTLIANYPNGFANGLTVRGIPIHLAHPGHVYWVSNSTVLLPGQKGGSNSNDGSFNAPFSTVDYAIGRCTANRGDIIMVKPGHAENLTAAAAIVSDVAGVAIVGLGTGTLRPTFSWTTIASADWDISAANCSFVNLRFIANVADVTTMFDMTGVDGISFQDCYFSDTSGILNAISVITAATGADQLYFGNCQWNGLSASNDNFFVGVAHDGFYMENCQLQLNLAQTAAAGILDTSGNVTNAWIKNCSFRSNIDNAEFIDFNGAANSGAVSNCYFSSIDTAGAVAAAADFSGGHFFECYVAGEADTYGIVGGGTGPYVDL